MEKRQRLKATKKEEEEKKKRTVFVGNLPVSCTKKVQTWGGVVSYLDNFDYMSYLITYKNI